MRRAAPALGLLGAVVLSSAGCGRRSSVVTVAATGLVEPLPPSELEGRAPAAVAPPPDAAPRPGPVGRKPVPVLYAGQSVSSAYARAAAPDAEHPKGTIAALRSDFVASSTGLAGEGTDDVSVVEVDLATATPLRSVPLARGVEWYDMHEGTRGPIVELQSQDEMTVAWLDDTLSTRARYTWPKLAKRNVELCGATTVGDRAVFVDCGTASRRTRAWVLGDKGPVANFSCPGRSVAWAMSVAPWSGRAVITGIGDAALAWSPCAFPVDGSAGLLTRSFPSSTSVFAWGGSLYVNSYDYGDGTHGIYRLDAGMRRTGAPLPDPRPPEVVAAESLVGYASHLEARLIEGLIVLKADHCCGEYGPPLYIFDPHADFE